MSEQEPEVRRDHAESSGDDAVIGVALRRSLAVIAVALVAGLAIWWWRQRPAPEVAETEIERAAPQAVQAVREAPPAPFTDITETAGVDFVHFNGATGEKLLPETMGAGAAFFDYDGDLDADLLLVNSNAWPHSANPRTTPTTVLYRNDGGRFTDVSRQVGLNVSIYGTGVAVGDYDGDGRRDLFLSAVGENRLLRNTPSGFVDVTQKARVGGDGEEWSSSAAFFDYDNDGDLDLFVCNYVRWSREIDFEVDFRLTGVGRAYGPPFNYEGTFPYLYRNNGDGTFTDVSEAAGVQVRNEASDVPVAKALGVLTVDADQDGWLDVFVANDTVRNFLFRNSGDGSFEEVGELWGVAYGRNGEATGAMGVDAAYYRNDGELGLAIGNFANEMTSLYLAQGDPTLYADEAIGEGIGAPSRTALTFGVLFLDYDLDGRQDILQVNGHLEQEINTVDSSQTYTQAAQLFWNGGEAGFLQVPLERLGDLAQPAVSRGSAVADIDGDGDLDIVITQAGGRPVLLRNDQAPGAHWLRVRLKGVSGNREAIGARLELVTGGQMQRRVVTAARSYQSQSELPVTFGLGDASEIDSLEVIWPDGSRQQIDVDGIDREIAVEQAGG